MKIGFCFLFLLTIFSKVLACTDFIIGTESDEYVVGRSMEFSLDLHSKVVVSPKGQVYKSIINGKVGKVWKQRYDYIGLDALGLGLIVDGVNEKGLSFGGLWFDAADYPRVDMNHLTNVILLEDFGNWILGSFANVKEVKAGLRDIAVYPNVVKGLGEVPPLHFSMHDRNGDSIVVEFIDGKMQVDDNVVGVLTNMPKFEWHMTNLSNYLNLSSMNKKPTKFDGTVLNPIGQGGGLLGLPGDWTPPSRFVRIAVIKDFAIKTRTIGQNVNLAFHFLNTVDIPYGVIADKNGKSSDYTQWIVVKDLTRGKMHTRTYDDLNIKSFDMHELMKKGFQRLPID